MRKGCSGSGSHILEIHLAGAPRARYVASLKDNNNKITLFSPSRPRDPIKKQCVRNDHFCEASVNQAEPDSA